MRQRFERYAMNSGERNDRVRLFRRTRQAAICACDFFVLFLSLFVTVALTEGAVPELRSWQGRIDAFLPIFAVWSVFFYISGLYELDKRISVARVLGGLFGSILSGAILGAAFLFLAHARTGALRTLPFLSAVSFVFLLAWRGALALARMAFSPKRRIAFIGMDPVVPKIIDELRGNARRGFEVLAIYLEDEPASFASGIEIYRDFAVFAEEMARRGVQYIVMAGGRSLETAREKFSDMADHDAGFVSSIHFFEVLFRRIPIGNVVEGWIDENIDRAAIRRYQAVKRFLDIACAVIGLALTLPLYPLIALLIRAEGSGPVFFAQTRLGKDGKIFVMLKFRTMRADSNDFAPTEVADPRITRIGKFLRECRIDEWPQMLNILRGEMSFVGPRPERPEIAEGLAARIPLYSHRHIVRPGITGWDQVSGTYHSPSVEDSYEKLMNDLYYIKNISLALDGSILLKTVASVFRREGR